MSQVDGWKLILAGVNLSLLPVLYWFTFLYYTDTLATLVVLVMMLLHLHRAPTAAAAMGGCLCCLAKLFLTLTTTRSTWDATPLTSPQALSHYTCLGHPLLLYTSSPEDKV